MKFKSALVTQASGSVGGFTAAHNAGGLYLRARSIPVNPNSPAQQESRVALATLVTYWTSTLTPAQRAAWELYASNVPVTDKLGDPRNISGLSMFVRCNQPRVRTGEAIVDDAPSVFTEANLMPIGIGTITPGAAGVATVQVTFDNTDDWANDDDGALILQLGLPQSAGINFFAGPFRWVANQSGSGIMAPTSPVTLTSPFPIAAGNRIFVRGRASNADGRLSAVQIVDDVA